MSLTEKTYRLGDEFDRLDERLDEAAANLQSAEPDTMTAQIHKQQCNTLETQLSGVAWLVDEYGADATVTIAGLDAGMFARVQDRAAAMRVERDEPGDIPGARGQVFAAMALVDAPFLADGTTSLDGKTEAVSSGLPIGVAKWIEDRANELTSVSEGNFTPLHERLKATQTT